jgi:hypothetical protein
MHGLAGRRQYKLPRLALPFRKRFWPDLSRKIEQAPRVDRPPQTHCYAAIASLPATQGQR